MENLDAQQPADSTVDALRAELEASLAAGFAPDGWQRQISWPGHGATGFWVSVSVVSSALCLVAGWVAWGWRAGVAAALAVVGLGLLMSMRSGPRVGEQITETFIPPDEVLLELGIAGHELIKVEQSRPTFEIHREATRRDRWNVRLTQSAIGALLVVNGGLVVLVESDRIPPPTFVRSGAIVTAAFLAAFAVWVWRRMGMYIKVFGPRPASDAANGTDDLLAGATTGGQAADTIVGGLLSRLPLPVSRVVIVATILVIGVLGVLVAFNVTPDESELWSSLMAGGDLLLFVAAGVRVLIALVVGLLLRDPEEAVSAVKSLALMGVLLLVAKLFGWLDEWQAAIVWVADHMA